MFILSERNITLEKGNIIKQGDKFQVCKSTDIVGYVDLGRATWQSVEISGWTLVKETRRAPKLVMLFYKNQLVDFQIPKLPRKDIQDFNRLQTSLFSGFSFCVSIESIDWSTLFEDPFEVVAYESDSCATVLKKYPSKYPDSSGYYFSSMRINGHDSFMNHFQNHLTRDNYAPHLFYGALTAARQMPHDPVVLGSAICIATYRIIGENQNNSAFIAKISEAASEFFDRFKESNNLTIKRWQNSVLMALVYLSIHTNNRDHFLENLESCIANSKYLENIPELFCHLIHACFLRGYADYHLGKLESAKKYWELGYESFSKGLFFYPFKFNFYAYDDIRFATAAAQECLRGFLIVLQESGEDFSSYPPIFTDANKFCFSYLLWPNPLLEDRGHFESFFPNVVNRKNFLSA